MCGTVSSESVMKLAATKRAGMSLRTAPANNKADIPNAARVTSRTTHRHLVDESICERAKRRWRGEWNRQKKKAKPITGGSIITPASARPPTNAWSRRLARHKVHNDRPATATLIGAINSIRFAANAASLPSAR